MLAALRTRAAASVACGTLHGSCSVVHGWTVADDSIRRFFMHAEPRCVVDLLLVQGSSCQRPILADMLRRRLAIGAERSRRLVALVRSEARTQTA